MAQPTTAPRPDAEAPKATAPDWPWLTKLSEPAKITATKFHGVLKDLTELVSQTVQWAGREGVPLSMNSALLTIGQMMVAGFNPVSATAGFIMRSAEHWESIRVCDDKFLIDNCHLLFQEAPKSMVAELAGLFNLRLVDGKQYIPRPYPDFVGKQGHRAIGTEFVRARLAGEAVNPKPLYEAVERDLGGKLTEAQRTAFDASLADHCLPFFVPNSPTRKSLWDHLNVMIRFAIRFVHDVRSPTLTDVQEVVNGVPTGKVVKAVRYQVECFPLLKVRPLATEWELQL